MPPIRPPGRRAARPHQRVWPLQRQFGLQIGLQIQRLFRSSPQAWLLAAFALFLVMFWWLFDWLTSPPILITLFGFGVASIAWLLASRPWQRYLSGGFALPLALILLITSPPGLALLQGGLIWFLPADTGAAADVIVVLGRGPDMRSDRVTVATRLWQMDRAPRLFVSGMGDAQELMQIFVEQDIPTEALSGERCSQSTAENALFTYNQLQAQGVQRILLVTDSAHMARSLLTFRRFGLTVVPALAQPPSTDLSYMTDTRRILREYIGLVNYGLTGQFRQLSAPEREAAMIWASHRLEDWGCRAEL